MLFRIRNTCVVGRRATLILEPLSWSIRCATTRFTDLVNDRPCHWGGRQSLPTPGAALFRSRRRCQALQAEDSNRRKRALLALYLARARRLSEPSMMGPPSVGTPPTSIVGDASLQPRRKLENEQPRFLPTFRVTQNQLYAMSKNCTNCVQCLCNNCAKKFARQSFCRWRAVWFLKSIQASVCAGLIVQIAQFN